MKPLRLLLVRHGQTAWNVEHRFQGQADIPLNPTGHKQAAALAQRLQHEAIQAIITSNLQRAQATAQAIASALKLRPQPEPRLRELSFGTWEGLTYGAIQQQAPTTLLAWRKDPLSVPPPEGETLTQMINRVRDIWKELKTTYSGQTVVLVAHGGPLRLLLCLALEVPPQHHWRFMIEPASLSELSATDQGTTLIRLNDTHHLTNVKCEDKKDKEDEQGEKI